MIEKQKDFSFPSGHTCASFASAFAIYKCKEVFPKKWRTAAMVIGYFDRIIEIICRGTLSDRRSRRIDRRTILGLGRM